MPISAIPKNFRDASLTISDDSAKSITVQYEPGDFQVDGFANGMVDVVALLDRGTWFAWRKTNQHPLTGSFSAILTDLSDASGTLYDAVMKTGLFSGGTSTTAAAGDVWTLDLTFTISYGGETHTLTLADCVLTCSLAEGDPDTYKVSFQTYAQPSAV